MGFISSFDMFKIGLGPSSSHTMGPWTAARRFLEALRGDGELDRVARVRVDLFGSLAKTGKGHGTDLAVILGLCDWDATTCDPSALHPMVEKIRAEGSLPLGGDRPIRFEEGDVAFHYDESLPFHPNALTFTATLDDGSTRAETYYSVGGGFVVQEDEGPASDVPGPVIPHPVETAADLLAACREAGLTIPEVVMRNERVVRDEAEVREGLARIWDVMRESAFRGAHSDAEFLPGGLKVVRRAPRLNRTLLGGRAEAASRDPDAWVAAIRESGDDFHASLNWLSCFALAVNEENAAFGRVVTAPTNGAAGVIPAVLLHRMAYHPGGEEAVEPFLLTAAVVGVLFKKRATISAAMGGCQAEIGVSSAMAAAGLTQTLGGTPEQALMAAEIAMEHHLGLTCDPIGGLVQVPCIERNTMGAVKAVTAAQLAMEGDPARAKVSLDAVIRTMWQTALDMNSKYKETSEGGLALQIPVNVIEC